MPLSQEREKRPMGAGEKRANVKRKTQTHWCIVIYTQNNVEDAGQASRKLAVAGKSQRQLGQGTIWGKS